MEKEFRFEDLIILSNKDVIKILKNIKMTTLVYALKNADDELVDKFKSVMSEKSKTDLKERSDNLGPLRVTDVNEAQEKIVALALDLNEKGEIAIDFSKIKIEDEVEQNLINYENLSTESDCSIVKSLLDLTGKKSVLYLLQTNVVADILKRIDVSDAKEIIENLEEDDNDFAEEIKKHLYTFEIILSLTDRDVEKLLTKLDTEDLSRALKNSRNEIKEKIIKNMTEDASLLLEKNISDSTTSDEELQESRKKIVSIIRNLEDMGEIVLPFPRA